MGIRNRLKQKEKEKIKDTVCLLEVSGKAIDIVITQVKDQKVLVGGKKRPLPVNSYFTTSLNVLGDLDLRVPSRTYLMDRGEVINLEFAHQDKDKDGKPKLPKWSKDTIDLLINNNIFTAMFRGLSVTKMQMILYGCLGIVIYEIFGALITLVIQMLM